MNTNQIKERKSEVKMCGMRRKEDIAYANEVNQTQLDIFFFQKASVMSQASRQEKLIKT